MRVLMVFLVVIQSVFALKCRLPQRIMLLDCSGNLCKSFQNYDEYFHDANNSCSTGVEKSESELFEFSSARSDGTKLSGLFALKMTPPQAGATWNFHESLSKILAEGKIDRYQGEIFEEVKEASRYLRLSSNHISSLDRFESSKEELLKEFEAIVVPKEKGVKEYLEKNSKNETSSAYEKLDRSQKSIQKQ